MPTKEEIDALKLGTGAVLTAEWFASLVEALHEFRDEIDALPQILRTLIASDETEVSVTGTTETEVKTHRVVKSTSHGMPVSKLHVLAEIKVSAASTGELRVYVDGTLRITLTTTSIDYELRKGTWVIDPAWDEDSVHTISIRLVNSTTETTFNRLYELYVE